LRERCTAQYWIIGRLATLSISVYSNTKFNRLPAALVVVLLPTVKVLSQLLLQNRRSNPDCLSGGYALAFNP